MITPSEVLEHVYCPRFTWFMNVQNIPQHEETRFKVRKGREVHRRRATENRDYLRRKIGAVKREIEVYLASPTLRLRGIVDEVLWLKDGTMAPLDYKYTEARDTVFKTHETQIVMYAMLIREVYQQPVTRGFVAYIRDGSQLLEVPVTEEAIAKVQLLIRQIFDIIATGRLPRRTPYRIRCEDCCYKNICV
ncbi:MAG: CRISPR-associated protein Cas4 [Candidatus Competibacteraceae bacterium]|nr:MAG: CRISPR-associated protein Cas4 [Candidatus Competibacteraceae bacterium]